MTDYTARNVLLKDANGNYLIPYTEKADLSLGNLNSSGKAYVAIKGYDSSATYSLNEVVMTVVSGSVLFYRSLADNNSSALSDTTKWEAVSFGSGANIDLSNLSTTGEAHFANPALSNSPYTTNRILEIPQDIKLELNNGTLTLKAGSKVYVPNGFEQDGTTPKFDVRIIENDIVDNNSGHNNTELLTVRYDGTSGAWLFWFEPEYIYSGNTAPTVTSTYTYWYDTANNLMKWTANNGSTWYAEGYSLPIALGKTNSSGTTTSIDQVFNGFGYIGSTVFALPGVKVQIPDGRNEDGTCKSVYGVIRTVQQTSVNPGDGDFSIRIGDNFIAVGKFVYDGYTNYNYNQTVSPSNIRYQTNAGTVSYSSGKITSFEPYTVGSIVNSNDFYQLKDNAVTLTDNQTITGAKTFSDAVSVTRQATSFLSIKRSDLASNATTPSASLVEDIPFLANDGSYIGRLFCQQLTTGLYETVLRCTSKVSGTAKNVDLRVGVTSDGTIYATAPNPSAPTQNNTVIATTKWCQDNIGVVDYSSGSDVTASVVAASGTGYKPSYKGVLLITSNTGVTSSTLYVYDSNGTEVHTRTLSQSIAGASGSHMQTTALPVNPNFSYRVLDAYGTPSATFFPYYSH